MYIYDERRLYWGRFEWFVKWWKNEKTKLFKYCPKVVCIEAHVLGVFMALYGDKEYMGEKCGFWPNKYEFSNMGGNDAAQPVGYWSIDSFLVPGFVNLNKLVAEFSQLGKTWPQVLSTWKKTGARFSQLGKKRARIFHNWQKTGAWSENSGRIFWTAPESPTKEKFGPSFHNCPEPAHAPHTLG